MRRLRGTLTVAAALPRQRRAPFLAPEKIAARRDANVRRIVAHAARTVPYYCELLQREGIDPRDIRGARDLDRLPLTDPEEVRADPARFTSDGRRARGALTLTSGALGRQPLQIAHDRRSLLANIAYGERERAPVIALCGSGFRPRELHIGYDGSNFKKVLAFYAAHTRRPSPRRDSLLMVEPFDAIVAAVNAKRPDIVTAYGGFLDVFFREVVARGVELHAPKVVMYMGEPLSAERREWIEGELGARVMSRYCATEAFKIGYFCELGTGFHLHDDLTHVRVIREDGSDAAPGEMGEIVISNLINHATVLLNHPMRDIAALAGEPCPCGRGHRLMSEVQGRVEDALTLPGGEHLHPREVWSVFKDDRRVLQYQLIQHDLDRFELKLVTASGDAFAGSRDRAVERLRAVLGEGARIEASHHAELGRAERERTGKFHAVQSRIPSAV